MWAMRVLEARFHPQGKDVDDFVVVGHVVWGWLHRERPRVLPAPRLTLPGAEAATSASAMLSKLEYLVSLTSPGAFERLQSLPNRFWSFVDVSSSSAKGGH
jgi:hypothetical protein